MKRGSVVSACTVLLGFGVVSLIVPVIPAAAGVTPLANAFTYQGKLEVAGVPYNGTADFVFRLFDGAGGGAAQVGANVPINNITVVDGVFTVTLDFGAVFQGDERYLDIQVDTPSAGGVGPFTALTPRHLLNATPYAAFALAVNGANITDLNANNIATGTIANARTTGNTGNVANTLVQRNAGGGFSAGAITATSFTGSGAGLTGLSAASITGILPIANGGTSASTAATAISNLTTGAMTLNGANIDVTNSLFAGASDSVRLTNNQVSTYGGDGLEQIRLWGSGFGEVVLFDSSVTNDNTVVLSATSNAGGSLILRDATGALNTANLLNETTGGRLLLRDEAGVVHTSVGGATAGGLLQLYQSNGTTLGMNVDGDASGALGGAALTLYQGDGNNGVFVDGDSGGAGLISVYQNDGSIGLTFDGDNGTDNGGRLTVNDAVSAARVILQASDASLVLDNPNNNASMELLGNIGGETRLSLFNDLGNNTVFMDTDSNNFGRLLLNNSTGATRVNAGVESDGGGQFLLYNASGVATIQIDANYGGPDGRIITDELQITGGSDLSEQFDIAAHQEESAVEPGMVVCIDPDNAGKLLVSTKAYDRCVAGIISGAGGIKPGMLMGQKDTEANGRHPVALTGRVYVRVTDANGSIEPGDLLTSSDEPGKAMKVTDFAKAHGAIIGKAMTRVDEKSGMVLVLVGLQ